MDEDMSGLTDRELLERIYASNLRTQHALEQTLEIVQGFSDTINGMFGEGEEASMAGLLRGFMGR